MPILPILDPTHGTPWNPQVFYRIVLTWLLEYFSHANFQSKHDYFQIYLETDDYMTPDKNYAVRLKFQYKLGDNLEGFYMSRYKDKGGNTR